MVDIDLQAKGLRNFEIDFRQAYGEKKQLRSINLSQNNLVKLNPSLEKTLQFLNVSFNKIKSLNGIESCVNLKFLNVMGNQISSVTGLGLLQNLREAIIAFNQLSQLKEVGTLKNLQLLDLSHNKIIDYDKVAPLSSLKKLAVLSLQGNMVAKTSTYLNVISKMFQTVKVLDPPQIKDYSMFLQMEAICFTGAPEILSPASDTVVPSPSTATVA